MSKRLKKLAPTLQYLANCNQRTAKTIIREAPPPLVHCVSDICYNLLNGKVKLTPKEKKRLIRYKKHIRKVAKRATTKKTKKKIIQTGGFLRAILAPLLGSVLAPLTQSIFGSQRR